MGFKGDLAGVYDLGKCQTAREPIRVFVFGRVFSHIMIWTTTFNIDGNKNYVYKNIFAEPFFVVADVLGVKPLGI